MAKAAPSSPLIVVSYSLPFHSRQTHGEKTVDSQAAPCSLASTVLPLVTRSGGYWVGCPDLSPNPKKKKQPSPAVDDGCSGPKPGPGQLKIVPVQLNRADRIEFNSCCRETVLPLLYTMPDKVNVSEPAWEAYRKVNADFADAICKILVRLKSDQPDQTPLVWILDFHLMLAALSLRKLIHKQGLSCRIGFFCHTPFPTWDVVGVLPWADELLQGILSADVVAFHHTEHCWKFFSSCQIGLGCRVQVMAGKPAQAGKARLTGLVEQGGRSVNVLQMTVGMDLPWLDGCRDKAEIRLDRDNKTQVILSVERWNCCSGIANRLKALELLFEQYPEHRKRVQLVEVCLGSPEDKEGNGNVHLEKLISDTNKKLSTSTRPACRFINGDISQDILRRLFQDADVAVLTPLRKATSLVAKEFILSRTPANPGVLVLSRFAGIGPGVVGIGVPGEEAMREALFANPFDVNGMAEVMNRALEMVPSEREARMHALRAREAAFLPTWQSSFLSVLLDTPASLPPFSATDFDAYLPAYINGRRPLCLLLDYDGTLAPLSDQPYIPKETKAVLERLIKNPNIYVAIVSGRSPDDAKKMVGIDGITYAGDHGMVIKYRDGTRYDHPFPRADVSRFDQLRKRLAAEVCEEGAWLEDKGVVITYHYREIEDETKRKHFTEKAKQIILDCGIEVGGGHGTLECKPHVNWDKGRCSIHLLKHVFGHDWSEKIPVIVAGDDLTDEDAFYRLKGLALSFRVAGKHLTRTSGDKRMSRIEDVRELLNWLETHMQ